MRYFVITDFFAAPTCDLTDTQFEQFLKVCKETSEEKEYEKTDEWIRVHGNSPVLCVEYRENWIKSDTETDHNSNVLYGTLDFATQYVKIIPASIAGDAPSEFIHKQDAYDEKFDCGYPVNEIKFIEQYLRWAKNIKDNDPNAEQGVQGNSTVAPLTIISPLEPTRTTGKSTVDAKPPTNEDRDRRLCEVAQNTALSWPDIAETINREFQGEQLDGNSAEKAAKRYVIKHHNLSLPERKVGRKPIGLG